jgi:hypothetical protein
MRRCYRSLMYSCSAALVDSLMRVGCGAQSKVVEQVCEWAKVDAARYVTVLHYDPYLPVGRVEHRIGRVTESVPPRPTISTALPRNNQDRDDNDKPDDKPDSEATVHLPYVLLLVVGEQLELLLACVWLVNWLIDELIGWLIG